ncbi:hypothetical protein [Spiroplasma endosymbiont of Seladonia tumulorum]|uniref:hypothetical protein n=1 Tax=Spiroplasma endosymbiont of Seladonia tumulorum TaxID=3066321 RepID=UPI0030CD029D
MIYRKFLPWSIAKNYIQGGDILGLVNKNGLEKVLLNYLTYRYNYDRKFQGAKYDEIKCINYSLPVMFNYFI